MSLARDLFSTIGNGSYDLARVLGALAVSVFSGVLISAAAQGQQLDFAAIGLGFGSVLVGAGGLIFAKDSARTAAVSQVTKDASAGVVAEAVADQVAKP
jgi:hypothetical protein